MARSAQKLSSSDLYMLKWILGALMGLVSVSTVYNLSGHNQLPATFVVSVIGLSILCPGLFHRIPELFWKLYAVAIIPLVSFNILAGEMTPTLLDLNTWLILYRALNHEKRREEMQLALLCLFLLIMTGIMTSSLLYGFQLLLFSGLAISYLIAGTILESNSEGGTREIHHSRQWSSSFRWSSAIRATNGRDLSYWMAVFVLMMGIGTISFYFIPRVDMDRRLNLFKMNGGATLTGFSETIALGEVTDIKKNDGVALRVDVSGGSIAPVEPYWRMLSLDEYDNGRFSLSRHLRRMIDDPNAPHSSAIYLSSFWPDKEISDTPSAEDRDRWTFYLEPGVSRFLPLMGDFKQLTYPNSDALRISPHAFAISMPESSTRMTSYQIEAVDFSERIPAISVERFPVSRGGDADRHVSRHTEIVYPDTLLALPEELGARAFLSKTVAEINGGEILSRGEFVHRATRYLQSNHNYSISIKLPEVTDISDPVIRWMRSDLDGHCELFASSLILLARTAGIPARAAVGFRGGDWNGFEKYFMVRNADAHAWCEFIGESGDWIRADPTPGAQYSNDRPAEMLLSSREGLSDSSAFLDSLRMIWYRRIVNFDEKAQMESAVRIKEFIVAYIQVAKRWTQNALQYFFEWILGPWTLGRILYLVFLASLIVGAYWVQYNLTLSFREWVLARIRRYDPVRRKAGRLLDKCMMKSASDSGVSLEGLLRDLQRLRFGSKDSWPNARIVFKEARRRL